MFIIKEITLSHFTGMWLNSVSEFKLTLTSAYTLVLGRNGCGKSRLFAMLGIHAPNKTDFNEGGGREMVVEFNGETYHISNRRVKTGLKNTIINETKNETLLDGVNSAMYNEFVKNHFGYDQALHDLLTGKLLFTQMRTPERRKWFSILTEADLTYAIRFYQKSKEALNAVNGAISNQKRRVAELKTKVVEEQSDLAEIEAQMQALQNELIRIDKLLAAGSSIGTLEDLEKIDAELHQLTNSVLKTNVWLPSALDGFDPVAASAERDAYLKREAKLLERVEHIQTRLEKARRIKGATDRSSVIENINALSARIESATADIVLFTNLLCTDADSGHVYVSALALLDQHLSTVVRVIEAYNVDLDTTNVQQRYLELANTVTEKLQLLQRYENILVAIDQRIETIEHVHDISCVNCQHTWKPGIKPGELEELKTRRTVGVGKIDALKGEIATLSEQREQYERLHQMTNIFFDVVSVLSGNPLTAVLVEYMQSAQVLCADGIMHLGKLRRFGTELQAAQAIFDARAAIEKQREYLAILDAAHSEDTQELETLLQRLESEQASIRASQQVIDMQLQAHRNYTGMLERMTQADSRLGILVGQRRSVVLGILGQISSDVLKEERVRIWDTLIVVKERFDGMTKVKNQLKDAEEYLIVLEKRAAALKHIVNAMSPETGILSKHIYQSITKVTELMSLYISRIWGYEMHVCPCDIEDGELDYKFPFWCVDKSKMNADVSLGSKGQREVIDFVFVLAVYKAQRLTGWPLLLDELGSGFDEQHSEAMIDFIKTLMERREHSQLLMVSHDAATHYQLANAEVVVLDPVGVTLPSRYNTHVTIR